MVKQQRTAEWHQEKFADFAAKVTAISGATPHLIMVGEAAEAAGCNWEQTVWRGGCYAAVYNYSAAEALWLNWTPRRVLKDVPLFTDWVRVNWRGLPLRKERKAVNSPKKLAACVVSFAQWLQRDAEEALMKDYLGYLDVWELFGRVYGMGRYISIRFLEYCHRYAGLRARMFDSRPKDGKYPRQGLSLLYPEHSRALLGGNEFETLKECNEVAERCLRQMYDDFKVNLDHYSLQSLICEYKQAALGGKQYPVQALDSELGYHQRVAAHFGKAYLRRTQFKTARARFAPQARGELQGWTEKRKPLGATLREYGYNWSDVVYDWAASQGNLAEPVMRAAVSV